MDNYKERMELIQNPLLHIISHCIELTIKETICFAINCSYINGKLNDIVHCHSAKALLPYLLEVFKKIGAEELCNDNDKYDFTNKFPTLSTRLINTLKTDTTSYRYAFKINKKGDYVTKGHEFCNDEDSPNIIEIKTTFMDFYDAITYTKYILDYLFPDL